VIAIVGAEPRGDGLALGPETEVRVIAPAGQPVGNPSR
jgi:hypothetical protein